MKYPKCNFNKDIQEFGVYRVFYKKLVYAQEITCIHDYNHSHYVLHHFIKYQNFIRDRSWFEAKNIKQRLILLPRDIHNFLHTTSEDFEYMGFKWYELLFCKKKSTY